MKIQLTLHMGELIKRKCWLMIPRDTTQQDYYARENKISFDLGSYKFDETSIFHGEITLTPTNLKWSGIH